MSKELKIGDTVQINKVTDTMEKYLPHLLGSHVTVVRFDDNGQGVFADDTPLPEDCPYDRNDLEFLCLDVEYGWEYEIL